MQIQPSSVVGNTGAVETTGRGIPGSAGEVRPPVGTRKDKTQETPVSSASVQNAADKLGHFVSAVRDDIQFSTDEVSGDLVLKVVDRASQEVIMQLPSKEALEISRALEKFQGMLIKQQA